MLANHVSLDPHPGEPIEPTPRARDEERRRAATLAFGRGVLLLHGPLCLGRIVTRSWAGPLPQVPPAARPRRCCFDRFRRRETTRVSVVNERAGPPPAPLS